MVVLHSGVTYPRGDRASNDIIVAKGVKLLLFLRESSLTDLIFRTIVAQSSRFYEEQRFKQRISMVFGSLPYEIVPENKEFQPGCSEALASGIWLKQDRDYSFRQLPLSEVTDFSHLSGLSTQSSLELSFSTQLQLRSSTIHATMDEPQSHQSCSNDSTKYSGDSSALCTWRLCPYEEIKPYSDFTIICGQDVYPTHRVFLAPQSDFFKNAFKPGFKVRHVPIKQTVWFSSRF
jgi:hypothetical protein